MSKKSNKQLKRIKQKQRLNKEMQLRLNPKAQPENQSKPIKPIETIQTLPQEVLKVIRNQKRRNERQRAKAFQRISKKPSTIEDYYNLCRYPKPTFEMIQKKLKDRKLSLVSKRTGLSFPTIRKIITGEEAETTAETLLRVNRYFYEAINFEEEP